MFTKTTIALAVIFATASTALAATKQHGVAPSHDLYDTRGAHVGADPDSHLRFELRRDWDRGQQ